MDSSKIILNTIVFKDELDQGVKQATFIEKARKLGVSNVEIRREFLGNIAEELDLITARAKKAKVTLFYSINDDFIIDGKLNPLLGDYIAEAEKLQAKILKLNTGDASQLTASELQKLAKLLPRTVQVSVENNQTKGDANLANIEHFMQLVKELDLPLRFVFDTGNWAWVGEDYRKAQEALAPVTTYLHLKNFKRENGKVVIASLFDGELDIVQLIKEFPGIDYYALEYPCSAAVLQEDLARLLKET